MARVSVNPEVDFDLSQETNLQVKRGAGVIRLGSRLSRAEYNVTYLV